MNTAEKIYISESIGLLISIMLCILLLLKINRGVYTTETGVLLIATVASIVVNKYLNDIEDEYYRVIDDIRRTTYRYDPTTEDIYEE